MDTGTTDSLVFSERSRAFTAALWFRLAAVLVIGITASYRHSLPSWMREGFILVGWPLLGYNLVALLARTRLERLLARYPGLLTIDLILSIALLAMGGGWRNSYFSYTLTTLIFFMIFLHRRGVWVAAQPIYLSTNRRDALRHFLAEALMNTWKHSGSTAGSLGLRREGDDIFLEVSYRGCGFDPQGLSSEAGLGLRSMGLRAQELGGRFEVDSRRGRGCRLRLRFPVVSPASETRR